jgi:hypothetical protein
MRNKIFRTNFELKNQALKQENQSIEPKNLGATSAEKTQSTINMVSKLMLEIQKFCSKMSFLEIILHEKHDSDAKCFGNCEKNRHISRKQYKNFIFKKHSFSQFLKHLA